MKIAIIGGSMSFGLLLAARLAECQVETVLVAPDTKPDELDELTKLHTLDAIFQQRVEQIKLPPLEPLMPECTHILPGKKRYNRKPKWAQNNSGSKYF